MGSSHEPAAANAAEAAAIFDVHAASIDLLLEGDDVDNASLSVQPPVSVRGGFAFRGDSRPPKFGSSRSEPPLQAALTIITGALPEMTLDGNRFRFDGILPGPFRVGGDIPVLRGPLAGWWLTSIAANGVELLDAPNGVGASLDVEVWVSIERIEYAERIEFERHELPAGSMQRDAERETCEQIVIDAPGVPAGCDGRPSSCRTPPA